MQRLVLFLEFRRRLDLRARDDELHRRLLIGRAKLQQVPIDRDLAAADTEKPAEIDHRRARLPVGIDEEIDDPAHILPAGSLNLLAENAGGLAVVD